MSDANMYFISIFSVSYTHLDVYKRQMENYMKEIQPGTTVNVCEAFKISGPSDVTLQASELISLSDDKDTQIIKLQ